MSKKIAFFTICSANYLSYALTLAASLTEAEPGVRLHVFLADRLPEAVVVPDDHIAITGIDELAIDDLDDMTFRYSILELNTAIKPYCFDYLFDVLHYEAALYLDPDILVLQPLEHVRQALEDGASCMLTPHITGGLNDGRLPDEDTFLTCGVFNLGFAAFANAPEARSFITWWGGKTRHDCIVAIHRGIFTDQSYCNFAPCFLDGFHALRNPGYNVAYWNFSQRPITTDGNRYFADGELVRFVHFSGIEPGNPTSFSKHQNRFTRRDIGALKALADRYVANVLRHDQHRSGRFSDLPYAFGRFRDGSPISELFRLVYRRHRDDLPAGVSPFELEPAFFNEAEPRYSRFDGCRISRLYAAVWEFRTDLQRAFDLGTPKGQADFHAWAMVGLRRDYGIDAAFILPPSHAPGEALPAPERRRWQKDELFDLAITSRSFMLRNLLRRQFHGKQSVREYWERRLSPPAVPQGQARDLSPGLDIYGFFRAETGVGQTARGFVEALQQTAVPFSCRTLHSNVFANDVEFRHPERMPDHDTALICANADFVTQLEQHVDPELMIGRRKLTHWAWELPVFPAGWASAFEKIDEVWTASRFVARSVRSATRKPVRVVPYVVRVPEMAVDEARSNLKLPQDCCIFLTVFDLNSYPSRKNPIAAVRAFRSAFPDRADKSQLLIVKYHGRQPADEFRSALADAIAGDPRILHIDAVYSATQMAWLRAACDVFVSLHRSEGFGLNIAEAMAAEKLAIATGFSGNADFMRADNSLPIPYRMTEVGAAEYPFGAGQWWAEPDYDAAVEAMRWAFGHPDDARILARRGKQDIRSNYSPEAISRVVAAGLAGVSSITID